MGTCRSGLFALCARMSSLAFIVQLLSAPIFSGGGSREVLGRLDSPMDELAFVAMVGTEVGEATLLHQIQSRL